MRSPFVESEAEIRRFMRESGSEEEFNRLALRLFQVQRQLNPAYSRLVQNHTAPIRWQEIPPVPTVAFKELEMTSLSKAERTHSFFSSGTTQQDRSRHFHSALSISLYEESALAWFNQNFASVEDIRWVFLTPPVAQAPNSSLVHMFATIAGQQSDAHFVGELDSEGAWTLDLGRHLESDKPVALLGTAFLFVHLLDGLTNPVRLPAGSWVLETGGYKGRSREVPKSALRRLITERLGIPGDRIFGEYGMSELSSQGYDRADGRFRFPHWARALIISPETGREAAVGEPGLIRIFDLANIWSVMAVQTEDIGIQHNDGIELCGRAPQIQARGCSLMSV